MKREGRWLFNFAALVSAALCIALVVVWIRSFWKIAGLSIDYRGGICFWVEVERGQLAVWKQRRVAAATQPAHLSAIQSGGSLPSGRPQNVITARVLGFGVQTVSPGPFDADVEMLAETRLGAERVRKNHPEIYQSIQSAGDRLAAARHTQWQVSAPMWALLLCLIWTPYLFIAKKWKLYQRKKLGLCLACGYDLCATPDRCPECGAIPAGARARSE